MCRVPPTLALHRRILQRITMQARLRKQNVNFLECAARSLGAVEPDVRGGEETAH
jgi:hypothetical protein